MSEEDALRRQGLPSEWQQALLSETAQSTPQPGWAKPHVNQKFSVKEGVAQGFSCLKNVVNRNREENDGIKQQAGSKTACMTHKKKT